MKHKMNEKDIVKSHNKEHKMKAIKKVMEKAKGK